MAGAGSVQVQNPETVNRQRGPEKVWPGGGETGFLPWELGNAGKFDKIGAVSGQLDGTQAVHYVQRERDGLVPIRLE